MDTVELFQIRFPRLTRDIAVDFVRDTIETREAQAICFPDASTINLLERDSNLKQLVIDQFKVFNDGAGLSLAAYLRGKPFPENLNGTDFTPALLQALPKETTIYLVGSTESVAINTLHEFQRLFPHLKFLGAAAGFFDEYEETQLITKLQELHPQVVLVGMGNPKQLKWIAKWKKLPEFSKTSWLAIGGLFDFYGGKRRRAPKWIIENRLEWVHILLTEPHKFFRYIFGIPLFLLRMIRAFLLRKHSSLSINKLK